MEKDKLYRVIEPMEQALNAYFGQYGDLRLVEEGNKIYMFDERFDYGIFSEEDFVANIGDIVDFNQIERWIETGMQPMYFTEEVKERYGKFENLKELTRDAYDTINEINLDRDNIIKKLRKKIEMLEIANKSYKEDSNWTIAGIIMQNKMNKIDNYNLKGYFIDENDLSEGQEKMIEELINEK